jgi:hypothetical protein
MLLPAHVDSAAAIAEYRRISNELKRLAREASGLNLRNVKVTLPALPPFLRPLIKMPLGGRIGFITTHDRRHLWQAEQVRTDPNFPAAPE